MKLFKRKQKFIISKEKLEGLIKIWWGNIDEDFEYTLDEKMYGAIEQISVMAILEFAGKMIDYCDYEKRNMTSKEIHTELCKRIKE